MAIGVITTVIIVIVVFITHILPQVFTMLGQSDEGRGIGDGIDTDNIFKVRG